MTVTKNPKSVERRKKGYEIHLRKMKKKILAGDTTPSDNPTYTSTTPTVTSTTTNCTPLTL